jgi:hypothetical protein
MAAGAARDTEATAGGVEGADASSAISCLF